MSRFIALSALGLLYVANSPLGFAQTKETQNKEGQARDRRLEDALIDIRLLKLVVDQQARRITDLEKTVKALQAAVAAEVEKPAESRARVGPKPFTGPKWQNPIVWSEVNKGMSRTDVEAILGAPTSVDSVIDYQTLHYSGTVGGEIISGTVKLEDDRVSDVSPPAF